MKYILPINVKMPTIVGILTFIDSINASSESSEGRTINFFQHYSFREELKFHAQVGSA